MRVCIVGCGFIGSALAMAMEDMDAIEKIYVCDKGEEKASALSKCRKVVYREDIFGILDDVSLVIEAASQDAVRHYAPDVLEHGRDILVLSVGAFADEGLLENCTQLAKEKGCRMFIPTGALCGVDAVRSASAGRLDEVVLISTKPVSALADNEYLRSKGIDLGTLKEAETVFEGTAREAALNFPKTSNVAATLSIAGIGFDRTRVRIIADPETDKNTHEISAKGEFGELRAISGNVASEKNPRTSLLAFLSALSALESLTGVVWVGI